jgi:hypothetical protein
VDWLPAGLDWPPAGLDWPLVDLLGLEGAELAGAEGCGAAATVIDRLTVVDSPSLWVTVSVAV